MSAPDSRIEGKVALVTGSSSGAGVEIARELGRTGAHVAVHCRSNLVAAEQVAAEIRREGHSATAFRADFASADETRGLAADSARYRSWSTMQARSWERHFSKWRSTSGTRCWPRT